MKINNVSFKANTNISDKDGLLSSKEIKKLEKAGKKIGTAKDSIDISVRNCDLSYDMFSVSYSARFNSITNPTNISSTIFLKKDEVTPLEFLEDKLTKIQALYKKLKRQKNP